MILFVLHYQSGFILYSHNLVLENLFEIPISSKRILCYNNQTKYVSLQVQEAVPSFFGEERLLYVDSFSIYLLSMLKILTVSGPVKFNNFKVPIFLFAAPAIFGTTACLRLFLVEQSDRKIRMCEVSTNMKRYLAFLRGINVSGKNKIPMAELRKGFEKLGFIEVETYLNSGNVTFSKDEDDITNITNRIEAMLKNQFAFDIPVFVMPKEELEDVLHHAPSWWGNENKEIYDNLIFIMPPATFDEVFIEIGQPKKDLEKIKAYKNVVFWSFSRKEYQKTNWWSKTAGASVRNKLTIRTANTVRKIVGI